MQSPYMAGYNSSTAAGGNEKNDFSNYQLASYNVLDQIVHVPRATHGNNAHDHNIKRAPSQTPSRAAQTHTEICMLTSATKGRGKEGDGG